LSGFPIVIFEIIYDYYKAIATSRPCPFRSPQ
jgi:hypothetical protein